MRQFDQSTIALITAFEKMTGTEVRDCVKNECIYFLVDPGKAAIAIGKGGQKVQNAEKLFKKPIKVYEWSEDPEQFIKNLIPGIRRLEIHGERAIVSVDPKQRGAVIGKGGSNINMLRELLARNSAVKELKLI